MQVLLGFAAAVLISVVVKADNWSPYKGLSLVEVALRPEELSYEIPDARILETYRNENGEPKTTALVNLDHISESRIGSKLPVLVVINRDLHDQVREESEFLEKRRIFKENDDPRDFDFTTFHNLSEINAFLDSLSRVSGEVFNVGLSFEGRAIRGFKFGRPSQRFTRKPAVFVMGGIHAREWISPATVLNLMYQLVFVRQNSTLLNDFDFYFLPVFNVDGYEYSWSHERFWRKNRRVNPWCIGVDLNRNFPLKWAPSSGNCDDVQSGNSGMSEPETASLIRFLTTIPNLKAFWDVHSYSGVLLYPPSHSCGPHADSDAMYSPIAKAFNESIVAAGGKSYPYGTPCSLMYNAYGSSMDYVEGVFNAFALAPEMSSTNGFLYAPETPVTIRTFFYGFETAMDVIYKKN